jgi:predicted dehydrogenase
MNDLPFDSLKPANARQPRVGFLGVGWIGRHRMEAIMETGAVDAAAISDPSQAMVEEALKLAPDAAVVGSLEDMLAMDLDGIVIATPSAMHAEQSIRALDAGAAVFCQKPLGRTAAEVAGVVDAARRADRLLAVDLSYRHTVAMNEIRRLIAAAELGDVFAVDLVFHNAYGPDKDWFYDRARSGGGCLMDLGVHLADLALWALDFPAVRSVTGSLMAGGKPLAPESREVEDYAVATITLETGAVIRLACSWRLHAGTDAVIGASFYGTAGGASMVNVGGSFYDFSAEAFTGTSRRELASPPDAWGGRAAADWATRLGRGERFDAGNAHLVQVAEVLDAIYGQTAPVPA